MRETQTKFGHVTLREFGDGPVGLVALHGFTQHGGSFEELASLLEVGVVAVDLPGHGQTQVEPITFEVAVSVVAAVLESIAELPALLGYSQGGRIALGVALTRPELIDRLILVSASAGIGDPELRRRRSVSDDVLAGRIEDLGVEAFIDEWLAREMFAGLRRRSAEWRYADRALRVENTPSGLAAALRGMGQGAQPYLGGDLNRLVVPLLAVAGGDDSRYAGYARCMARAVDNGAAIVPKAGHAVIGESPGDVAKLVGDFIGRPD
ncbi:MAG: alpha/beta fold hydrolase [Acidimicrobiia bacterium]